MREPELVLAQIPLVKVTRAVIDENSDYTPVETFKNQIGIRIAIQIARDQVMHPNGSVHQYGSRGRGTEMDPDFLRI